jgi:hypothetical protein
MNGGCGCWWVGGDGIRDDRVGRAHASGCCLGDSVSVKTKARRMEGVTEETTSSGSFRETTPVGFIRWQNWDGSGID